MALSTSLVAYWSLDEASGNALDATGRGNTLTETSGTIDSATGIVGNARDFEATADSEYFEASDNTDLSTGDIDFTFALWVKPETLASFPLILRKGIAGGTREYALFYNTTVSKVEWNVVNSPTTGQWLSSGALTTGNWFFIVVGHDSVNNTVFGSINGASKTTVAHSAGCLDGTGTFQLGAGSDQSLWWDGLIDEVGMWKRVLTDDEITELYNSGAGRDYTYVAASGGSPYTMTAAQGSFTLSGQAAALTAARKIAVANGSYVLTGEDATLTGPGQKAIAAAQGSFALTGQSIGFEFAVPIDTGIYAMTGIGATLRYSNAPPVAQGAHLGMGGLRIGL